MKSSVNTSLGLVGGCILCTPPICVRAWTLFERLAFHSLRFWPFWWKICSFLHTWL